ncbi:MAG: DNA metabolism protein [Chitinophagaceae bacterium]|nr:MAG: DNA metabolism protein [Chitinophagaceae bacterium]
MKTTIYLADGGLEGLLCAIFEFFDRKQQGTALLKMEKFYQPDAFSEVVNIINDPVKAHRVWVGLSIKLSKAWLRRFYCTFLSEEPEAYHSLFEFACYIFLSADNVMDNYGDNSVLTISQTAVKVEREKHRMEAFIRFQQLADGMFYCGITPDFNVLPLIVNHFRNRYADQKWIIYDLKRHYGLYYDLQKVEEIYLDEAERKKLSKLSTTVLSETESLYNTLWKDYFKSTNIVSRKNTKLHVRHVPKRYWKYLTEKQDS